MSDIAIEFNHVSKKFKKGETNDSLRDLIPYLTKKAFRSKNDLSLREQEFWAVEDVDFRVTYGEVLGIIGANGAGKSTVLKLISGIMKPDKGSIKINGRLSALIEVGAGFHPDLTGRENIFLNGAILGMRREEIRKKLDEIIEFSELSEFIDTPVKRYSSGMFARLGFAVAAHVEPKILLVDEVLSVGDFSFQRKCLQRMEEISKGGTTIIYISHNIPSVISLCPRSILLKKGSIEKQGPSKDVCRHYYKAYSSTMMAAETYQLKINDLSINSLEGEPASSFDTGDWASLRLFVESSRDIQGLSMGFFIRGEDGMVVFDGTSELMEGKTYDFTKGRAEKIEIKYRNSLPKGAYFVGIHFWKDGEGFYYYDDEVMEVYINSPQTSGSAFLDVKW